MSKIVECVPNFSEGRNSETIEAIAKAMRDTPGVTVLDVDPGKSTNRTVYTMVGSPEAVVNGAVNAATAAKELIDMTTQTGEHPRFGAMDVCPFIPVANATMDDCVTCAEECGKRLGELGLPVYLYEYAAKAEYRRLLPQVRQGEYEGIRERIGKEEWKPDFGPSEFVPKWGCTAVGARKFLIAYNINVLGTKQQAHRIALDVREQGRGEGEEGKCKAVKGIGWYVDEYGMAQVSLNLVDIDVTPMHVVFEACRDAAAAIDIAIVGSEVVGVVPMSAIDAAADYYIKKENLFILDDSQRIRLVIQRLGLSSVTLFEPQKKIVELMIASPPSPLISMTLSSFVRALGSRTSAPGGGSASAAVGAMGAGLGAMVGWMTYGYRAVYDLDATMRRLIPPLHHAMEQLIPLIDKDTDAFNDYMIAQRMPQSSVWEIAAREDAMQKGLQTAVDVPLQVMRVASTCWESMIEMAEHGNINSASDLQVGAKCLNTAIWGAHQNIVINLKSISNEAFRDEKMRESVGMVKGSDDSLATILTVLSGRDSDKEPRQP